MGKKKAEEIQCIGVVRVLSNVRVKPCKYADVVTTYEAGKEIVILGERDGYYETSKGYIFAELVRIIGQSKAKG